MHRNQLSGPIPAGGDAANPTGLAKLTPDELRPGLKHLNLELNNRREPDDKFPCTPKGEPGLTGGIPAQLGYLTQLTELKLHNNKLTGSIPAKLGDLTLLEELDFHNNKLSGPIPKELGNLTKLTHLELYINKLSGAIPSTLGNLTLLEELLLYDNQLGLDPVDNKSKWGIPPALGNLTLLTHLELHNNKLSGAIPSTLGNLAELKELLLYDNQLGLDPVDNKSKWGIPPALGNLTELLSLDLDRNQLSGTIPDLSRLTKLGRLALDNNRLNGDIPNLDKLVRLDDLRLHGNALIGPFTTKNGYFQFVCLPYGVALPTTISSLGLQCPTPALTSDPGTDGTYETGDDIKATLTFKRAVEVITTGDTPTLTLQIGDQARKARYSSGSGTPVLTFSYTVKDADADADGIAIATDQLELNGGDIVREQQTTSVDPLLHPALPAQAGHKVNQRPALAAPTNLEVTAGNAWLNLRWTAPLGTVTGYDVHYKTWAASDQLATTPADPTTGWVAVSRSDTPLSQAITGLTNGRAYAVRVRAVNADGKEGAWARGRGTPQQPIRGGGGGGGRGGGRGGQDRHGNTPAQATPVRLRATAPWRSSTPGEINTFRDRDYFRLSVPHAGILVVETSGTTDTVGTVWQAGDELGTATDGGPRRNFRLSVPVAAGPVVIAVTGNRGRTGRYSLRTRLLVGVLENPAPASFQSGIGVISGWVCAAEVVEIELNGQRQPAATGTARADTAAVCGDADTGFGLLFNWNLLGDGEHTVVAFVDDIELARATVTVTTLGAEIVDDAEGTCEVADFPSVGERVTVAWQASSQNFVIIDGAAPTAATQAGRPGVGSLENPRPNSYQSGIGLISGWVCEADAVEIVFNAGPPQAAGYGTARADTVLACGDADNGFGLLFNWNLLGDGEHTVAALVDGAELGRAVVRVTTLGEELVEDAEGECVVEDFPGAGETVTLRWQPGRQNFGIVAYEAATASP